MLYKSIFALWKQKVMLIYNSLLYYKIRQLISFQQEKY